MELAVRRLLHEIDRIPLVDPHSHVMPHAPAAKNLAELLGYHYYTELAHSAGLPKSELEAEPQDVVHRLAAMLPTLANTVQYSWLVHIAQSFFGFEGRDVSDANVAGLWDAVAAAGADPAWPDKVFEKTNLEAIFLTNDFDDPLEGFDTRRYVPCLRTDDLVFKLDQPAVRERLAKATGETPVDAASVCRGLDKLFTHFVGKGARACAISLPPDFEPVRPDSMDVETSFEKLFHGAAFEADRRVVANYLMFELADRCEAHRLPFDLMIGVRRGVYEAGVYQGTDLFDQRTSLYQFRRLFNEKPKVTFPVSVLTHGQNQELASYAWIFPNVVTCGHWWYSNIPAYIEPDLRGRLEAVPMTKQIGYYSDAYKLEFVLPKFAMYKACLARVLIRDFVIARGWTEDKALKLARTILRDNILETFPARNAG